MRKLLILLLSIVFLASCSTMDAESATISVSGSSTVYMHPDNASFAVSAEAVRETTDEAREATDAIITEAVSVLKDRYGISDEDIRTNYLSLSPEYRYVDNQRVLTGQRGYQSIDVSLSDISVIGPIVEDLAKINGISISSITLDKSDKSAEIAEARRLALTDAIGKAATYASAIGRELGTVISISDNSSPSYSNGVLRLEAASFAASSDAAYKTTFYSYDLSCSDSVSIIVELR